MQNFFHNTLGKIFPNSLSFFTLPKALLSFVFSIVISITMLSFLSWITYSNLQEMGKRTADVTHTYQVRFKNKELIKLLVDAETGQRGYLLTGNDDFLKPYIESQEKIDTTLHQLTALVNDNAVQAKRLDSIKHITKLRLKAMEINIERIRKAQSVDTLKLYLGKFYMDKIRILSQKVDTDEEHLLQERDDLQKESDKNMTYYLLGLSVVTLAFLTIFFRLLYLELKQRIALQTTLEHKLTEVEHTNAELEQFAYITSHDLQEPLRKIRAFGERLYTRQSEELSEDAKNNILKINQSASRMQLLINDLLTFSRITNVKDDVFDEIDLNWILNETKEDFSELIYQKKAMIYSKHLPTINGIRVQLIQLFNNLISNSLKYSRPDVNPVIEIKYKQVFGEEIPSIGPLQQEKVYHKITFMDNGIGFEEKYSEKIFTIFQRLHNKNEYEGTGIGLAICRRIVTNHNGYIIAEVKKDYVGAIFHVYLPY
ncbi:histidine kinase [Emticicia aquatilis]|uniref:histidine kinase n=1 Tax=Emticicia aquatilis TaxID=1537369 RepID=A0A916YJS5_9BACT|nr:sensor histidine kinase [Emticicia aquatilis]GGD46403.1 histidine kinase [Emticicia aquatilis]